MKAVFKNGQHSGYSIGEDIQIHSHINDPEGWFLTIRNLDIFACYLCSKSAEEHVIALVAYTVLAVRAKVLSRLMDEIKPFTNLD